MDPPPPLPPHQHRLLSILYHDPPPPSFKSFHTRGRSATKISPSSGSAAFSDATVATNPARAVFDPALSPTPSSPSDPSQDLSDARDILWNHFGFIPTHPDLLLLDGYKSPPLSSPHSPLHPSSVTATHQRILPPSANHSRTSSSPPLPSLPNMAKKRRSLQAILVPSFPPPRFRLHLSPALPSALSSAFVYNWLEFYTGTASPAGTELASLAPVTPSRQSPPPDLLDEDPFADLSPAPSLRSSRATSPVRSVFDVFADSLEPPRSPLAETAPVPTEDTPRFLRHAASFTSFQAISSPSANTNLPCTPPPTPTEPSQPLLRRPKSSGPPQVRPAWTRPAFKPRPSLPSLNMLARTSIHVPKPVRCVIAYMLTAVMPCGRQVRRGRPGAHLPLEPWEDPAPPAPAESEPPETQMSMFAATRSVPSSPVARRRGHIRRPTLSMIRDSRMFVDVDADADAGAGRDGQALALDLGTEPEEKEPSSARATPTPMSMPRVLGADAMGGRDDDDHVAGVSFLSISPEDIQRGFRHPDTQGDQPPTPPPKPPSAPWHARSMSETSTTSTCTVPSLCPSSPTSTSSESAEHHHHHQYHYPAYHHHHNIHPHVHIDTALAEHTAYPSVFSAPHIRQHTIDPDDLLHHRHTQLLTSDLLASLEYDYSEALSRLSVASGLAVPSATSSSTSPSSSLFPPSSPIAGEFQPGSSAGTIRNIAHAAPRVLLIAEDDDDEGARRRMPSDRSVDSMWSTEATDAHAHASSSGGHGSGSASGGDRAGWFRRGSAGNGQDDEDDDGDGRKRRPARLPLSSHAAAAAAVTESESESESDFEVLSDVCGSWNTDKTVNLLVIKKTLLAPLLSPKAMPSASPVCSGYVHWEYKRGKWQKRWMELREHSLWLSKRDTVCLFVFLSAPCL
ncbi:hypothetical protein BN946_scf184975.g7 [Trametes cinnabarina]|uniref:Uncharacterized protein n=1 Tax=Pycnoporus cinnabarinus TaxID=5643 RepID=A0A060SW25_PYCCI|nr:hypothetical protein BN946_scf184975.g7 [Trametes cinnabarina]